MRIEKIEGKSLDIWVDNSETTIYKLAPEYMPDLEKSRTNGLSVCIGGELPLPFVINGMLAKKNDHSMNEHKLKTAS